ncbi:MAG TPA: dTMP kinase [Bacteroidales bacterium]|jgi:dTMP kinase|nr:dTMP kinase [Bacteroidales bacterium]HKM12314.1 dTMP kinase [Bacteroidales bacterium]HPB89514.1 dTMP kinase [Bacteroidales bacterium]HPY22324.1 dTMP kinase [Bacteroidales bacterium]HQA93498.1 dTMP kinase [Bacteroidales bacterium]
MLIVLEGLDGAGKSTQLTMVSNYMESRGNKVEYLHFPRFDAPVFGDLIARFLRGDFGSIEQVHPQLVALLFAEDRRDAAPMLRNWLDEGRCVVLDRYYYSNIAFQCSKLESAEESRRLRDWIIDVELGHFDIPAPDLNLFLDVPINFVDSKLSASRKGDDRAYLEGKSDIHEADIDFQIKVRNIYLEQCALDENFKRIDCSDGSGNMLPANDIFIKIRKELEAVS